MKKNKLVNKIVIGILLFVFMVPVLVIINHFCLNNASIILQALVSGAIAAVFIAVYTLCIYRK